ncbi:MAG: hypothetical protein JSR41_09570 [Proteobacteria bacterium]|nr:hypothetical protein [Pseudomonadota bacterium]
MAAWDSEQVAAVRMATAAASDATRWPEVLQRLARRFGATAAAVHTPTPPSAERTLYASIEFSPDALPEYLRHWASQDPWFLGAARRGLPLRDGYCVQGEVACPWDELRRTAFYNDFARPQAIQRLMTLIVDAGREAEELPVTVVTLYRRPGLESFSAGDVRALGDIHAPLQLAVHAHWALSTARRAAHFAAETLDELSVPVWVLDGRGGVLHANAAGSGLLADDRWLQLHGNRLVRIGQCSGSALAQFVDEARCQLAPERLLWLPGPTPQARPATARARLVPMPEDHACRTVWPKARMLLFVEGLTPARGPEAFDEAAKRHGLTPAERGVLAQLVRGRSPQQIAQAHARSVHTVRAQLRQIFDKTGVRRQSELVRVFGPLFGD